ncbi:MAG: SHOCT domain-containing protein [Nitrospirota bacterium]
MQWGDYGWGWGMGFGWFIMMFFWVLVIIGVIYLIKVIGGSERKGTTGTTSDSPLDILRKRYAKGEINKEEFDRIKEDIEKQ